jgi:hypothetical protein
MCHKNSKMYQSNRTMSLKSNSFDHHLILIILIFIMGDNNLNINRF